VRLGALGDGRKWVCGHSRVAKKPDCVVYSFGKIFYTCWFHKFKKNNRINYESSFEADIRPISGPMFADLTITDDDDHDFLPRAISSSTLASQNPKPKTKLTSGHLQTNTNASTLEKNQIHSCEVQLEDGYCSWKIVDL
jgi:hypothetical protein